MSPEKLESLNITKEQFDKVAAAIQEASHSTPAEVVKEDAGDSDDDKDGDNDQKMAPADASPEKEEPPPAKAKETAVLATRAAGQSDQAQGFKRNVAGREDDNTFQDFVASLGMEAGNEEKFSLDELGPKFEAYSKAKKQRTQRIIKAGETL